MTPEYCADILEGAQGHAIARVRTEASAHLRRLASTETALHNLRGYVVGLEEEVKQLRGRLERAEVVLRALDDDHVRTEMRAHGKSVGDTRAALAREALESADG